MSVPNYRDISKSSNDVLRRDFYHQSPLSVRARTSAPNGVQFVISGASDEKSEQLRGTLETKYTDKPSGVTVTQGWLTSNRLTTRVEVANAFTPGLTASVNTSFDPAQKGKAANASLDFKNANVNANVVANVFDSAFTGNVVFGRKGFVSGVEVAYDVRKGEITQYGTQAGYIAPEYSATVSASNKFNLYTAQIYHRVNPAVDFAALASWKRQNIAPDSVTLEGAVKYTLDPTAYVKARLNNFGIAAFAYSQRVRPGVTLGVGIEANLEKLNESSHKIGLSLDFSA